LPVLNVAEDAPILRPVDLMTGGDYESSFFVSFLRKTMIGCGNVGMSRAVRDFQVLWEPPLGFHRTSFPQPSSPSHNLLETGILGMLYPYRLADRRS